MTLEFTVKTPIGESLCLSSCSMGQLSATHDPSSCISKAYREALAEMLGRQLTSVGWAIMVA